MAQSAVVGDGGKLPAGNGKMTARTKEEGGARPATGGAAKAQANGAAASKAAKKGASRPRGLGFERRFTHRGVDPLDEFAWVEQVGLPGARTAAADVDAGPDSARRGQDHRHPGQPAAADPLGLADA